MFVIQSTTERSYAWSFWIAYASLIIISLLTNITTTDLERLHYKREKHPIIEFLSPFHDANVVLGTPFPWAFVKRINSRSMLCRELKSFCFDFPGDESLANLFYMFLTLGMNFVEFIWAQLALCTLREILYVARKFINFFIL